MSAGLGCCGSCVSSDSFRTESVTNVEESNSITIPMLDEYVWLSSKIEVDNSVHEMLLLPLTVAFFVVQSTQSSFSVIKGSSWVGIYPLEHPGSF